MSVPAWPMPIHQTKLMMSKPQPTGWLLPQMPMPVRRSFVIAVASIAVKRPVMPIAIHQAAPARLRRTIELIWSVTVVSV
jgi:hypothetical protein